MLDTTKGSGMLPSKEIADFARGARSALLAKYVLTYAAKMRSGPLGALLAKYVSYPNNEFEPG